MRIYFYEDFKYKSSLSVKYRFSFLFNKIEKTIITVQILSPRYMVKPLEYNCI